MVGRAKVRPFFMTDEEQIKNIKQIKEESFIKYVGKDKKGNFSYVGKVVAICNITGFVTIETFQGTMAFKICKENDLFFSEKPVGWDKFEKDPFKYRKNLLDKEKSKDIAPPVKTLKEMVFDLVTKNIKLNKKKLIKTVIESLRGYEERAILPLIELALVRAQNN